MTPISSASKPYQTYIIENIEPVANAVPCDLNFNEASVIDNEQVRIKTPRHEYIDFLIQLSENPSIKNNPTIITMIEDQVEELMSQETENLTQKQQQSYNWTQKLLTDGKVSQLVFKKLQKIHQVAALNPFFGQESYPSAPHMQAESLFEERISINASRSIGTFPNIAFGKAAWATYFGDIGVEPLLPPHIGDILTSRCPFWPDKKMGETHFLMLIPKTVNGKPLSLGSLGDLVQNPLQGFPTKFACLNLGEYSNVPVQQSYWVLMSRDVLEGSRGTTYKKQCQQVAIIARKTGTPYAVPKLLEAAICIFMHYVSTGQRPYSDDPLSFTRCQEFYSLRKGWTSVIGGFSERGLNVSFDVYDDTYIVRYLHDNYPANAAGISACRKLEICRHKPRPITLLPDMAFGKAAWDTYFGDIGVEPPLPPNIDAILNARCPFWPDKKVQETHLLVLIPKTINRKPMTLETLKKLIESPKQGFPTKFTHLTLGVHNDPPVRQSYWVLMSRDVLENSLNKDYKIQCREVANLAKKTGIEYSIPKVLEAAICVLMHYVVSGQKLFNDTPQTYIRCQELHNNTFNHRLAVGNFTAEGLNISFSWDDQTVVAPCCRLKSSHWQTLLARLGF